MTVQTQPHENPKLAAALALHAAGVSVVPVRDDGSKAPAVAWKEYQRRQSTPDEIRAWFGPGSTLGMGAVTGAVSGNLLMIEFEARAEHLIPAVSELAIATGQEALWEKFCRRAWTQRSGGGGVHFIVRTEHPPPGNQKLAVNANGEVLAETRGEGGYFIAAPSNGTVHPSGQPYRHLSGGPETAPTLAAEELEDVNALIAAALRPARAEFNQPGLPPREDGGRLSPGDDYESRTDFSETLAGWLLVYTKADGERGWKRPGKTTPGISATTGHADDRERFFNFSTSAGLPVGEPMTQFGVYTWLNHGGNFKAASAELRKQGYGDPQPGNHAVAATQSAAEIGAPLEDSPLAQWAADLLKGHLCWAGGLGWMAYKKGVWKEATEASIVEKVRKQFRQLHKTEIAQGAGYERAKRLTTLHSAGKIRAVASLLKGILEVDAANFDHHPDLLNVANGVIDLRTGALLEHSPDYYFTKVTKVDYRPGTRHDDWHKALQAMPEEVQSFMQVRFGQAATGHPVPDDIMPVLQGDGENGKSTVIVGVVGALGDHAVYIPERLLLANPGDHPTELTTLQGARFAIIEETPEARQLNIKRLKDTVGTPTMTARRIKQDSITWKTTHTLFLTSNYRPRISETDNGTWRRLALVRFPYTYIKPGELPTEPHHRQGDQGLRDRLSASREATQAVLVWLVEGAMAWYANDKTMPPLPDKVREDTEAWRGESDTIGSYLAENIEFDEGSAILSSELLAGLNEWLKGQGQMTWSGALLAARLESNAAMKHHPTQKRRVNNPSNLSRLRTLDSPVKYGKETVWQGIRFRR